MAAPSRRPSPTRTRRGTRGTATSWSCRTCACAAAPRASSTCSPPSARTDSTPSSGPRGCPGSAGTVGMYGFSYQGITQLMAAAAKPPALRAICPAMAAWDSHADMAYENGAFRLQSAMGWAIQLAAETARRRGDAAAYQALHAASRNVPVWEATPARPAVLERFAPDSHYHAWLAHPALDDYWALRSPSAMQADIDVPALWIARWYDSLLDRTIPGFRHMSAPTAPPPLPLRPSAPLPWTRPPPP